MKILIAFEGSECSQELLHDLSKAALPGDTNVSLVHVIDAIAPETQPENGIYLSAGYSLLLQNARSSAQSLTHLAHQQLASAKQTLSKRFPKWQIQTQVRMGSPVKTILEKASLAKADLICVGSHNKSSLEGALFGSVSSGILHNACTSVRVCRGDVDAPESALRMIVAADGSFASEYCARKVLERKWPLGTAFKIVAAADKRMMSAFMDGGAEVRRWLKESDKHPLAWLQHFLSAWQLQFEKAGYSTQVEILEGDPKKVILKEAELWEANCIFIGSRGLGMGQRLLLGSSSSAVASRAHCSVEVVKTCEPFEEGPSVS